MMNLTKTLRKGAVAAASSYRLLITMWLITLLMVILVALPLKSSLKNIFGNSVAVERLSDGFDLGLTGDIGDRFGEIMSSATTGGVIVILAGVLLYIFFTGGLFSQYTTAYGRLSRATFFRASAQNFISFLLISLLIYCFVGVYTMLILGIPAGLRLALARGSLPEGYVMVWFYAVWALGMPVWLLVADYSRRWMAATGSRKVFRALGEGFRALRRRFWFSYLAMLVILLLNCAFIAATLWFTAWMVPEKGVMIVLFFIATQMLFIFRLFMKAWRYATVCEMAVSGGKEGV
jgi:hypothetical protein